MSVASLFSCKSKTTIYPLAPLNSYSSLLLISKKRGCHWIPSFWRAAVSSRCLFSINVFSSVAESKSLDVKPAVTFDQSLKWNRNGEISCQVGWVHCWLSSLFLYKSQDTYFLDSFHSWLSKGSTCLGMTGCDLTSKKDSFDEFYVHGKRLMSLLLLSFHCSVYSLSLPFPWWKFLVSRHQKRHKEPHQ